MAVKKVKTEKTEENAEKAEKTVKTKKTTEKTEKKEKAEKTEKTEKVKKTVKTKKTEETTKEVEKEVETTAPKRVEEQQSIESIIEQKLLALYTLQQVDSKIDKIRNYRGALPYEVKDLEDEVEGLETRIANFKEDAKKIASDVANYKIKIKESTDLVKKYEDQQNNVRNNREYDSLSKEIEFQNLEVELAEKRIRECGVKNEELSKKMQDATEQLNIRKADLETKKAELDNIVTETEKEESDLLKLSQENQALIEERLLTAYERIRKNARNGLAVVKIDRDACAGCFNKIPPQHQLDISIYKKIIVCEYCGRILVDDNIVRKYNQLHGNTIE